MRAAAVQEGTEAVQTGNVRNAQAAAPEQERNCMHE